MVKLNLKNPKPLTKVGSRGHYTMAQKRELMSIADKGINVELNLKALASKWNRNYSNVRSQYNKIVTSAKELVNKELAKRENKMHVRTVDSIHNSKAPDWTEFETELVMEALDSADNKTQAAREVAELLEGRTVVAIKSRYKYIKEKESKTNVEYDAKSLEFVPLDFNNPNSFFIPEKTTDLFTEEVSVIMYKSLDGSLHEKAQDAVKANIRFIIDSMATTVLANENADDSTVHQWFFNNKDKVEYLMNTNPEELW